MTGYRKSNSTDLVDQCLAMPRCRLVYQYANSTLLDAKLTSFHYGLPDTINGVAIVGPKVGMKDLLKYKAIVFLEGNDVSSGVKWALYSQSIVLMPRPTVTSWAMEELLEPWVHYVPIGEDLSDVEEKIQWVLDHDLEAFEITKRATLWMYDLTLHPDAAVDDKAIYREILLRYRAQWM
jgi:Glycosyl transferase family 90